MAAALVQSNEGTSALAITSPTFASTPTSGNLVVLYFTSDDYNGTPNTGWTQSTGMEQQTFHGGYIWWQVSTGAQPPSYTIGSASGSSWVLEEWSGLTSTPYDISNGAFTQTTVLTSGTQATPTITPTSGDRLLLAMMGASNPNDMTAATGSFNNSFSVGGTSGNNIGATRDWVMSGNRSVTADGVTGYTTTGTVGANSESRSGLIIAFKAAGPPAPFDPQYVDWPLRQPHPKMRGAA
jgi:hypothetical protein